MPNMKALIKQHDEIVMKMALLQLSNNIYKELGTTFDGESNFQAAYDRYISNAGNKTLHHIMTHVHTKTRDWHGAKQALPKLMRIAAATLAICFIGTVSALAWVPSVRQAMFKLLIQIEERYTELRMVDDIENALETPSGWNGSYFPAYIPEIFTVNEIIPWGDENMISYISPSGSELLFFEHTRDAAIQFDTEGARFETVVINGAIGQCATRTHDASVFWSHDSKFFILYYPGEKETALRIAQSVIHIN